MRSLKISTSIYFMLVAVTLFAIFIAGIHVGKYQSWLMESSARALLIASDLKVIRAGKSEKLIETKEALLDGEILLALQFQQSGHPWMFFPFSENYDHENYLHKIALYRQNYPSITAELDFDASKNEIVNYQAEVAKATSLLIEKYGK